MKRTTAWLIALAILIPTGGQTDVAPVDPPDLSTICESDFGTCTGEVYESTDSAAGSISCTCYEEVNGSMGIEADLEAKPGETISQEMLDTACASTLENCGTDPDAESHQDDDDEDASCSFSGKSAFSTAAPSLLKILLD